MKVQLTLKIYEKKDELNIGDSTFNFLSEDVTFVEKNFDVKEKKKIHSFFIKTTQDEEITVKIEQPPKSIQRSGGL